MQPEAAEPTIICDEATGTRAGCPRPDDPEEWVSKRINSVEPAWNAYAVPVRSHNLRATSTTLAPFVRQGCLTLTTNKELQPIGGADKTQQGSFATSVPRAQGTKAQTTLGLAELPDGQVYAAPWIGPLVALGARAWRNLAQISGMQLIITVTVPRRDLAAALVGCGWLMAHPAPVLRPPIEVLRQLTSGTPVRIVTDGIIWTSLFRALEEGNGPARVLMHGGGWLVGKINALSGLPALDRPERAARPSPGVAERFAGLDRDWDARLACPPTDLAIVGTRAWLLEDARAYLTVEGRTAAPPSQLMGLLLPRGLQPAIWSTRLYSSAGFADQLPLPSEIQAVILDGAGAIKYLDDVEAPIVICIIDRSIADETAAEFIVQRRNAGSDPVAVSSLGWISVPGIEALAFKVPL